ncbi:hypothetical protein HRI_004394900 [Hibiscus trionum]|uniref:Ubiquitin-like domain-containing protein n=1 Tax=Hibiscus trionum TaxID=183268 RepID=A0A9W7J6I0_HIBTR|nr:hypothetical protein HRI_004394900 [Hibiscus trionum]
MGSSGSDKAPIDTEMEDSEATIEIKIKTLDSQTYTLRVDKQMPVPALKEQIASATGVLSEQQRLICRGAVLKDDQLLSAYHVEDGHTLHLVVRQPVPPSSDGSPNHSANNHASGTGRGHSNHVPVSIETFNVSDQGDGVLLEISRIVSTILGSLGLSNMALASDSTTSDARGQGSQRLERTSGGSGMPESSQVQIEQASRESQSDRAHSAFGLPAAVSLGTLQPPVIPDSLATLSQYLSQIRNEFDALGRAGINDSRTASMSRTGYRDSNSASNSETVREGLPTPASLAEVLLSTRQLLTEQAGESLQQLARQVEGQGNVTDPSARLLVQSNALRTGALLNNLGSFLLELGRTTMTLRLGQTASEAVVNAGPAVFISPSGPIPLMARPGSGLGTGFLLPRRIDIQIRGAFISPSGPIPLMAQAPPFQPGASTVQPGSGLGTGFLLPRRIGIQIRGGSSTETPDIAREEHPPNQSGQSNQSASFAGESGVRVVPIRTMVAAVPAPLGGLPSESSGENPSPGAQPEQLPIPESAVQRQSSEESARDGSLPNANSRQQERPNTRSVNISIQESGRTQNNHQDSERQIGSSILQLQRTIYPGGEIQVEEASSQGTTTDSVRGQVETSNGAPAFEPNTADQGAFLSNLLHQIMPYISQHVGLQQSTAEEATTSTSAGNSSTRNSRRPSDSEPDPAKRQKME